MTEPNPLSHCLVVGLISTWQLLMGTFFSSRSAASLSVVALGGRPCRRRTRISPVDGAGLTVAGPETTPLAAVVDY